MDQQEYDRLFLYLRSAELPSGFTKNQKDSLKRKSKSFIIDAKKGVELTDRVTQTAKCWWLLKIEPSLSLKPCPNPLKTFS